MTTKLFYNREARDRLMTGINTVADSVKTTMGAKGRTVVINLGNGNLQVTKDGVTVARKIELQDSTENMGATLIKQAAEMTVRMAGDGTTTATLLAQKLCVLALKEIDKGISFVEVVSEIRLGVSKAVEAIKKQSKTVKGIDDIARIATVSANNDKEIGLIIAKAMEAVDMDGLITVEDSYGNETTVELVEGMSLNAGYVSAHFVTNQTKQTAELHQPLILIYDLKIANLRELLPVLEKVAKTKKELLILCEGMEGEALNTTVVNHTLGKLKVCVCSLPEKGALKKELMKDLAVLTESTVISHETGLSLEKTELTHLGSCDKVTVSAYNSLFLGGAGDKEATKERAELVRTQMEQEENLMYKEVYKKRLSNLSNGVAIIRVGAYTSAELGEKKDRIDDALKSAKAAVEEGYIAGGGAAAHYIGKEIRGIVGEALLEPMYQILKNAGLKMGDCALSEGEGWNVLTGRIVDMENEGIIDSAKVLRVALENAASVAMMVINTDCVID